MSIFTKQFWGTLAISFMLIVSVFVQSSFAQTPPYFKGGTGGSANSFPFGSTTSNKVQWVYFPSNFPTAISKGKITKLYFRTSSAVTTPFVYTNLTIKMGYTTLTTFTTGPFETGLQTCLSAPSYSIQTNGANNWFVIDLTTPFIYDPTKNFIVEVSQTAYTAGFSVFQQADPGNRRLYGLVTSPTGTAGAGGLADLGFDLLPLSFNDAGVTKLDSPGTFCSGSTQNIYATIRNFGNNQLTSVNVNWSVDGVARPVIPYTSTLDTLNGTGSTTATINLGSVAFPTSAGKIIKVWTSSPNGVADTVAYNDTLTKVVKPSLSGTFTVGPIGRDYTTLGAVASDLSNFGVCGPVVINVDSATYTGKAAFSNILGLSSVNTLTINGNGATIQHLSDVNDPTSYVVSLSGVSYTTFRNFKIKLDAASTKGSALHVGASNNCVIENNKIEGDANNTGTTYFGLNISGNAGATASGAIIRNNIFRNNEISGGYYSLYFYGVSGAAASTTGNIIENNTVRDFYVYGVYVAYADSLQLIANNVHRLNRTGISTGYGIFYTTGYGGGLIERNNVHHIFEQAKTSTNTFYGIYTTNDATLARPTIIANNIIHNIETNGSMYPVYNGGGDHTKYYYNSVAINNPTATAGLVYALYHPTAAVGLEWLNNNVYVNKGGTGAKYATYWSTTTNPVVSNYNNLHVVVTGAGTHFTGRWGTVNYASIGDWKTANSSAFDQNSESVDPLFGSYSIGNLKPNAPALNNTGTPVSTVLYDYTNVLRNSSTPDMGAYEFTPANDDAGITTIISPVGICPGVNDIIVRVKNFGLSTLSSVSVNWSVNGVNQTAFNYIGSVSSGSDTALTIGSFNFNATTTYNIKIWTSAPNLGADANATNDTVYINNLRTGLSGTFTLGGSGADFANFADLTTFLNQNGVCGPSTINVNASAGPFTGPINLTNISRLNASNPLTINGNGAIINSLNNGFTLNKISYLTLDSFVINLNGTAGIGISLMEGNRNTFRKNRITIGQDKTSTGFSGIALSGSSTSATTQGSFSYNTIENNVLTGGYYMLTVVGTSGNLTSAVGNIVKNNKILDAYVYSVYSLYTDSLTIENNEINRVGRTLNISTFYGIYVATGTRNLRARGNKIHSPFPTGSTITSSSYYLYISADATVGNENIFSNNAVYNVNGSGLAYGIYSLGSDGAWYHNNTIDIGGVGAGTVYGIIQTTAATNCQFINNTVNINRINGTGTRILANFATTTSTITSNYNHFNGNGGVVYGQWGTTQGANLTAWKAINSSAFDQNSIDGDPQFNGLLNMVPKTGSALVGAGTPLATVPTDIMGVTRNSATPTIGAYENSGDFSGPSIAFSPILNTASITNYTVNAFATITDAAGVDTSVTGRPRLYYKRITSANVYNDNTSATQGWKYVTTTNTNSPFGFVIDYSKLDSAVVTNDQIQYFVVAKDNLGFISINSPLLMASDPNSINLTSGNFPVLGTPNSYRISSIISGTFNVGTGKPYTTLSGNGGLFEYINRNVLGGDINIIVTSNLSETGVHALNAFSETGAGGYKINIRPVSDTLRTITGAFVGGLIRINGADRVTIDGSFNGAGKFLRIQNTTATSGSAGIQIISLGQNAGANNVTIQNTEVWAGTAGNSIPIHIGGASIPYSSGASNNNVKILNNTILRGSVGIYSGSEAGFESDSLLIEGNIIGSDVPAEQLRLYGMAIEVHKNAKIHNNTIKNIINTAAQQAWGIALYDGFKNGQITNNKIEKVSSGSGAFGGRGIEVFSGKSNENILIANNFIGEITGPGSRLLNTTATIGIGIIQTRGVNIYNNSINLTGTISATNTIPDTSAALYIGPGAGQLNIRNNSIVNRLFNGSDTSVAYALHSAVSDTAFVDINYNNYYNGSANPQGVLARVNGIDLNNLALLRSFTTKDVNSISGNPNYVSTIDLHAQGATLYQKGTSITVVPKDIDGENRGVSPCIGADEFVPPANDVQVLSIIYPAVLSCGKPVDSIGFVIVNLGTATQTGFNIKAVLTGAVSAILNKTFTKTLSASGRDTVYLGTFNSNVTGLAQVTVYTELTTDQIRDNDTIKTTREFNATPAMPIAANALVCKGDSTILVATNGALSYAWWDAPVGGNLLASNDSLQTSVITGTKKYWVETSAGTSSGSLKISEIDIGGTDMIEIQNLGQSPINTTGWKVIVSDSYTNINLVNTIAWQLPATIQPGQVLYKTDATADSYWGNNLFWNPGAFPSFTGWAMILDQNDVVVDALFMNWPASNIAGSAITYNSKLLNYATEWVGNGVNITTVAATNSVSRAGNKDNNNLSDFSIVATTKNATNSVLSLPFITGGCPSDRREVTVTLAPSPTGATVAQATPFDGVFNAGTLANADAACVGDVLTYTLTPPTGFTVGGLGTTWNVLNPMIRTLSGATPTGTVTMTGLDLQYTASAGDKDTTLKFTATVVNLANGCDSVITRYLTIYPTPIISLGTDKLICDGTSLTLDAGTGATYLWSTGASTRTIDVTTAGTYFVHVTTAAGCEARDTIVVTTTPSPVVNLGINIAVCAGTPVTLDAGNPGATYLWNTGATTQSIQATSAGIYFVTVTANTCVDMDTIQVSYNALPVVNLGADLDICTSDTVTISAGNPGATYLWNTGATTQTIRVNMAGTYSVEVTNTNGCVNTDAIIVTNKAIPVAAYTYQASNGLNVQFTATQQAGHTYNWNFGDPSSPANTSALLMPIHQFTAEGTYFVTLTVTNVATGCRSVDVDTIEVKTIGINNSSARNTQNLKAIPNPFVGNTNIAYTLTETAESVTVEIFDVVGRKVASLVNDSPQQAGKHSINYINEDKENASGVYIVRLTVDGKTSITRIVDIASK